MIDEIHFLAEGTRGSTLEAVVSRMKTVRSHFQSKDHRLRFLGASATISNVSDIARWLGTAEKSADCLEFGEEYRPVRLTTHVETLRGWRGNQWQHDTKLNEMLTDVMMQYNHQLKPTLIFCGTRKSCQLAIKSLCNEGDKFIRDTEQRRKLATAAGSIQDKGVLSIHKLQYFQMRFSRSSFYLRRLLWFWAAAAAVGQGGLGLWAVQR